MEGRSGDAFSQVVLLLVAAYPVFGGVLGEDSCQAGVGPPLRGASSARRYVEPGRLQGLGPGAESRDHRGFVGQPWMAAAVLSPSTTIHCLIRTRRSSSLYPRELGGGVGCSAARGPEGVAVGPRRSPTCRRLRRVVRQGGSPTTRPRCCAHCPSPAWREPPGPAVEPARTLPAS